jgi:hypothetical protein
MKLPYVVEITGCRKGRGCFSYANGGSGSI